MKHSDQLRRVLKYLIKRNLRRFPAPCPSLRLVDGFDTKTLQYILKNLKLKNIRDARYYRTWQEAQELFVLPADDKPKIVRTPLQEQFVLEGVLADYSVVPLERVFPSLDDFESLKEMCPRKNDGRLMYEWSAIIITRHCYSAPRKTRKSHKPWREHYDIGVVYEQMGWVEEAQEEFKIAAKLKKRPSRAKAKPEPSQAFVNRITEEIGKHRWADDTRSDVLHWICWRKKGQTPLEELYDKAKVIRRGLNPQVKPQA